MTIEKISSHMIYQGRAFSISQDQVLFPDDRTAKLDIVHRNAAVTMVPVAEDGAIWFIRQYRYPVAEMLLELPAGVMEDGEDPRTSAQRELREEIGLAA
ncbi:NUDIX domain-containing protein [Chloroflexota bacterium]